MGIVEDGALDMTKKKRKKKKEKEVLEEENKEEDVSWFESSFCFSFRACHTDLHNIAQIDISHKVSLLFALL